VGGHTNGPSGDTCSHSAGVQKPKLGIRIFTIATDWITIQRSNVQQIWLPRIRQGPQAALTISQFVKVPSGAQSTTVLVKLNVSPRKV
jgi:hypothetical protein